MNLVWFRNDLRTLDNPALWHATQSGHTLGVFYLCPRQWRGHHMAACRVEFLLRTLNCLRQQLAALNIPLLVLTENDFSTVPQSLSTICQRHQVTDIYWNDEYPVDEQRRDDAVVALLQAASIASHRYHDRALAPPGMVVKGDGSAYKVFTPFKRSWLALLDHGVPDLLPIPARQKPLKLPPDCDGLGPIPDSLPGFNSAVPAELWPAGEAEAVRRLNHFCDQGLAAYSRDRDLPAIDGTSALSPYLAVGAISPQHCLHEALKVRANGGSEVMEGADTWINELIWRDFYQHILVAFPRVSMNKPFKLATDAVPWRDDEAGFRAWCAGKTGIPIVDAGMRQLQQTGWMHNRVRMITAMFLSKNLLIDWRRGEQFFMQHLVDGDLAANNGGWQWSASTGTDAAPYFRIFNPFSQAERYDPDASYIRRYVPELEGLSVRQIHSPAQLAASKPSQYPVPIVDLKLSRQCAIDAFRAVNG
ncbi:MAG: hypothetical protein VR73_11905 [Gammaproteobacteria bacterium BRH_c0]|nr:MAG: hypothetical protein VR73_11905 [Gammaproteobacteria bacterium BRH_c0]